MSRPHIRIDAAAEDPRLNDAADLEWLLTDGVGGFACHNVAMCAGRRYHGLLTAPLPGTADRHLFLANLVERVVSSTGTTLLSVPRREGEPEGTVPRQFQWFELRPWPTSSYDFGGGATLQREIVMPLGRHGVFVRYTAGDEPLTLHLSPLLAFRDADAQTFANDVLDQQVAQTAQGLSVRPYDSLPEMHLCVAGGFEFVARPDWWRGVEYRLDLIRGYGGHEDLFCPGELTIELPAGGSVTLAATLTEPELDPAGAFELATESRRDELTAETDVGSRCAAVADDFLYVGPGDRLGIIAGFPWFVEWGRDTFLSLPGLTLARGQLEACAAVLAGALPYLKDGLLPNIFAGTVEDSHYGSVDAALWFARAALLYQRAGGDEDFLRAELLPALVEIATCYAAGTAPDVAAMGIGGDADGLIHAGRPDLNPTWMDAKPESGAVTPRHGCPVEIAALWYSLLAHLSELTDDVHWRTAADRAGRAFLERFWLEEEGYLADVWRPDLVDTSVRPNMVLAAALELSPLTLAQRSSVFDRARAELLTPVGLRTLAAGHSDYVARYTGGPEERDRAYHQGTVWPWLLGGYVELGLRASDAHRDHLRAVLDGLAPELELGGLAHLSEVFDGDPPHRRGGTFAQAWNTAEVLRGYALLDGPSLAGGAT